MNWADWRPFLKRRWFSLKINVGSGVSAAGRKQIIIGRVFEKEEGSFFRRVATVSLYLRSLNRRRPARSEQYLYIHPTRLKRRLLVMCRILGEDRRRGGLCCFLQIQHQPCCKYWLWEFLFSLKWLAVGWRFLCWVVNTDTRVTKFSCKMLLLACALSYSRSWRPCWYRPCADFPLLSYRRQQFYNRIKGIPQFPKIEVQEVYCPAEGSQNNQCYILLAHRFPVPTLGPCT